MADTVNSLITGLISAVSPAAGVGSFSSVAQRQELPSDGNGLPVENTSLPSEEEIVQAVTQIADYVQSISRDLQFRVDEQIGTTVITVVDSKTDEIIRQIPAEEAVSLARYISEVRSGQKKGLLMSSSE
ncbi:MAG: flagellar protein FlaG [Porticoccaceae bacterium]